MPVGLRMDDEDIESRRRLSCAATSCALYARQLHQIDRAADLMIDNNYRGTINKSIECYTTLVHPLCWPMRSVPLMQLPVGSTRHLALRCQSGCGMQHIQTATIHLD